MGVKQIFHTFGEKSTSRKTIVQIQEIVTYLSFVISRRIYFQLLFLPLQQRHPNIEIISEVTYDSDSALEENTKTTFEHLVEVPTTIFSNMSKTHRVQENERLRPFVESFFMEPSNSGRYLETKDKQANPQKALVQEVITEPTDKLLLSSARNQPDDPSLCEGDSKITVACPGKITAIHLITE